MIPFLFQLALFFLPFTSIAGLPFLGESQHELSAHVFLLLLVLSVLPVLFYFRQAGDPVRTDRKIYALPQIMMIVMGVIALSFLPNVTSITSSVFMGRTGLEKYISSTILVLFGFSIAFLTYFVATLKSWDKLIVNPIAASVIVCAFFSFFEMIMRWTGGMSGVFHALASLVYSSEFPVLEWDPRLRSVAFEPPDFANTAGYMWPWVLSAVMFSRGAKRIAFAAIWLVLSGMILLSEARTSLVVIAGLVSVFLVLWFFLLPKVASRDPDKMLAPVIIVTLIAFPLILALLVLYYDQLIYNVIVGDRVSNLTRLASMTAAFRMFAEQPIFGFGFGQYAFHIKEFMPSWGYYSWEIRYWLMNEAGGWPASFSVYARFAADMGLLGLVMWVGVWLWLAWQLLTQTMIYRKLTGELPFPAYPLIMSCFCVLLAGVPCDSVRSPMIWVNMGLACRYLYDTRKHIRSIINPSQATV